MSTATIHAWGNGHGVLIPKQYLEQLGVHKGDKLDISLSGGKLELRPSNSYRVEDLLKGYTGPKPSEYDWGEPMGRELW
jgi:antitoxin component of MazEF toxin-antitoxin module